jgi:hypothetical protein
MLVETSCRVSNIFGDGLRNNQLVFLRVRSGFGIRPCSTRVYLCRLSWPSTPAKGQSGREGVEERDKGSALSF